MHKSLLVCLLLIALTYATSIQKGTLTITVTTAEEEYTKEVAYNGRIK